MHEWFRLRHATTFPLGTLAVNLSGSLALGWLLGRGVGGDTAFVLGTGALGSYTTFSTWMLESERLVEAGEPRVAAANVGVSLVAGLIAVACGWALGRDADERGRSAGGRPAGDPDRANVDRRP